MTRRRHVALRLGFAAFLACAAPGGANAGGTRLPAQDGAAEGETGMTHGAAGVDFALALHGEVARSARDGNVFLSPWSVAAALSMVMNGAGGATREAIAAVLHAGGAGIDALNRDAAALRRTLASAAGPVELETAAAAWLRDGMRIHPAFLETARASYGAEIATVDFRDPAAADRVNGWVSGATHGRIPRIVERLDPETALVLTTAIWFKAPWQRPFPREETTAGEFHAPGAGVRADFMRASGRWSYAEDDRAQWVSLPYEGGRCDMVILLPRDGVALDSLMSGVDAGEWGRRITAMVPAQGTVTLPRFRMEETLSLVGPLGALGMAVAFDPARADFSGFLAEPAATGDLCIDDVRHRTWVEVTEEGTEAAGATSVSVTVTSAPAVPPFDFTADRPFFFAIREVSSGTLLFTGSLRRPRQDGTTGSRSLGWPRP